MRNSVVVSIHPQFVGSIMNGNKTLEIRKSIPKDFNGWVYIYCTLKDIENARLIDFNTFALITKKFTRYQYVDLNISHISFALRDYLNGKIAARFKLKEYINIPYDSSNNTYLINQADLLKTTLSEKDLLKYGKGKELYGWKIKDLEIFEKPLELKDLGLTRAPQSYQYIGVDIYE